MDFYGEFTPQITSWVEDRFDVNRIVIELDWVGTRPGKLAVVPPVNIPLVRREIKSEDGGSHGTSTYYFEGVEEDPSEEKVYDLEPSFQQEPIASHPKIGELMKIFGGYLEEGEVVWPDKAPEGTRGKKGLAANNGKVSEDINRMYGVQSYFAFGAIWTETSVHKATSIPSRILARVGTIVNPPGPVPDLPNRNWLEASPASTLRGNVLQVKRRWILSGLGGWIPEVYDGSDIAGGE